MGKQLVVIDGPEQGRAIPIDDVGRVILGGKGGKHTDIILNDPAIAPLHCQVNVQGEHVVIHAIESRRGTFINGQLVEKQALEPGDVLRVGNSHLRLQTGEPETPSEPGKVPTLPDDRLHLLAGQTLGHWYIGGVLGRAHCGVVFHARDLKNDRAVALKIIPPEFPANAKELQVFVQTMKTRLPLAHANLVGLYGAGKTGPYCWLAMEYVEGESLTQILKRLAQAKSSDWQMALRLAVHLGRALEFLHQHRLAHRDITPANIMVPAGNQQAKLGGLLFQKALEGSGLHKRTLEKKRLAELPYLAPEQITPGAVVDDLSDIYNLGAAVYALSTGRPPFDGESPSEIMSAIRADMPPRPRDHSPSIPDEFQATILKMLAKRPEERYVTPEELLTDLDRIAHKHAVEV